MGQWLSGEDGRLIKFDWCSCPIVGREACAIAAVGRCSRNGDIGICINRRHLCRLPLPVLYIVLNDAQWVNPKVPQAKLASDGYSVLKYFGKLGPYDTFLPWLKICKCGCKGRWSPSVRQGSISTILRGAHVKFQSFYVFDIDNPTWKGTNNIGWTFSVIIDAIWKPSTDAAICFIRLWILGNVWSLLNRRPRTWAVK